MTLTLEERIAWCERHIGGHNRRLKTLEAVVLPPEPAPSPTTPSSMYARDAIGPGVRLRGKGNIRVGPAGLTRVTTRFRASETSDIVRVGLQVRLGSDDGYSGGRGGRWTVTVQTDDGSGRPSGTVLGSRVQATGQSSGGSNRFPHLALTAPGIVAGRLYHVVVDDASPTDYGSINLGYGYPPSPGYPRQPVFTDDFGILVYRDGAWTTDGGDAVGTTLQYVPVIDITYANGKHDGAQFHEAMIAERRAVNATAWASERFIAKVARRVVGAGVALEGSGELTLELRDSVGTVLRSASATLSGGWLRGPFSPIDLVVGQSYRLVARGGSHFVVPLRAVADEDMSYGGPGPAWASYGFAEGVGEWSPDSGRSWSRMYAWSPQHLPSYLAVA